MHQVHGRVRGFAPKPAMMEMVTDVAQWSKIMDDSNPCYNEWSGLIENRVASDAVTDGYVGNGGIGPRSRRATCAARAVAEFQPVRAAKAVWIGEAAGQRHVLDGRSCCGQHRLGVFETEPPEHRARRLVETLAEAPDEMFAADAALRGDNFDVHRRTKMISQIMIAE